jgi:hypothetical protein
MRTTEQDQPAADPDEDEIEQTEGHERSSWPTADPWRIAAAHRPGRLLVPHRLASPADTDPYAAVDILDPRLDDGVVIDGELAECHIACAGHRFVPLDDLPVDQRFVGLMRMPETDWRDPQTIRNMAAGWTEAQACKWIEGLDGLMTSVENGCLDLHSMLVLAESPGQEHRQAAVMAWLDQSMTGRSQPLNAARAHARDSALVAADSVTSTTGTTSTSFQ